MSSVLVKNGYVLTMTGNGVGIIEDGAVFVEGENIVSVGKTDDLVKECRAELFIDAKNKAVLPGLIDAHCHLEETLFRGEAQDVPEIEWMTTTIGPLEANWTPEDMVVGAKLGIIEAFKAGTTCFGGLGTDMNPITEQVFVPSGARAVLGNKTTMMGPDSWGAPDEPYKHYQDIGDKTLKASLEFSDKWEGKGEGRITTMLYPQGADMMSGDHLIHVKDVAEERGMIMHIHVAQGGREARQMKARYGKSTVQYLDELGFLGPNVLAAHVHQTSDEEVARLAQSGARYVSCASSIGIIDGITPPLALYLQSGGSAAAIGSDQACGNNSHNMMTEMKTTSLLNKTRHRDPTVLPSWKMLRIATIEGATALGIQDKVGTLEAGKKADLIIMDLKVPHMTPVLTRPVRNLAPNIVYSATGQEVETAIINGKVVMENRKVLTMDEDKAIEDAQKLAVKLCDEALDDFMSRDSYIVKELKKGLY